MKLSTKPSLLEQKHGWLTPIKPSRKKADDGKLLWLCQCDCGNLVSVTLTYLKQSSIQSCGCLANKRIVEGEKYYSLTVLIETADKSDSGEKLLLCLCDCQEQILATKNQLIYGKGA